MREEILLFFFFEKGIFPFKGNVFKRKEEIKKEIKEETKEELINNTLTFTEKKIKTHR